MSKRISFAVSVLVMSALMVCSPRPATAASHGDVLYYYGLALQNDPQFKSSEYQALASREALPQAYAGLLPKLFLEFNDTYTFQDVYSSQNTVYAVGSTSYNSYSPSVSLIQPLFNYASYVGVNQAKLVMSRTDLEIEKARQDTAIRVVEAYLNVLLNKDKLAAVTAEESAVRLQSVRARERHEKGMAPITDRYDTEARLAAVVAQRIESENVLHDAFQALTEICGVTTQEIKLLKEDLALTKPIPDQLDHWVREGLRQNLDILIQKSKAEVANKEVDRQRAAHYPTVDFKADFNYLDTQGSLYGGGSNTSTYTLMAKVTVPIYEGGMVTSKTREALNNYRSAEEGVTKQNRQVERTVRSTYMGIDSAKSRTDAMKKSIEAQKLVVQSKEEGFKAGLYISLAVLDAMQDLYRYKKEYSQARTDYILNSFRLKHAVGALKQEDLAVVNTWLQE